MVRFNRGLVMEYAYVLLAFFIGDSLFVQRHTPNRKGGTVRDHIHSLVWGSCDTLVRMAARIKHLEQEESPYIFCVAKHRYLGRPFSVDGVCVRRFDPVIEIHMNNQFLSQVLLEEDSLVILAV